MPATQARLYYIDWIRIIAFGMLIVLHGMVPFTSIPWEINNKDSSVTLTRITFWLHQWRLPLLFFVSGLGIQLSMQRRSLGAFYGERFRRLFIPLLFAMFVTIPVQPYFEFLQKGKISRGYLEFYRQVWALKVYPDGPLTWSHMWFVVYLIAFIILLLPLFLLGKNKRISQALDVLREKFGHPMMMALPLVPIIGIMYTLSLDYPQNGSLTEDWFAFLLFITLLVTGYLIGPSQAFWNSAATWKWLTGGITVLTGSVLWFAYWTPMPVFTVKDNRFLMYTILDGIHVWAMILFWCGMARHYLNRSSPILSYLNNAVYPYYIIHQTIMVALGYYIVQWPLSLWIKCILLIGLSMVAILATYHLLIRRTRLTRFLFGMK